MRIPQLVRDKPLMFTTQDHQFMARALKLAYKGLYSTHPNPRVGCVIVRDGVIITEGWHQKTGGPHAEAHAIYQSSENLAGATAYVTLEPCSHHGRTPPCTDALIEAGITKVVVAAKDPNTRVNGGGIGKLKQANIEVLVGLLEDQARELNKGFYSLHEKQRPWVRLKTAASLDGRTAMSSGESQWITEKAARNDGHHFRAQSSVVLTGVNTVLADDPQLTARVDGIERQPARVILDSSLQIPVEAKIFDQSGEVFIFTCASNQHDKLAILKQKGASIIQIKTSQGRLDLPSVLDTLAAMSINEVHVEAGRTLTGEFIRLNLADELLMYLAPTLLGDNARGMFSITGLQKLSEQRKVHWHDQRMIGNDLRLIMRFTD